MFRPLNNIEIINNYKMNLSKMKLDITATFIKCKENVTQEYS